MDEKDFMKEFGELTGRFRKIEEEVEELKERVRGLELKIAYYTGLGTSIGIVAGILIEKILERVLT
ncbi:MAG: hypothetical protein GXN96_01430 [Aquificae bacterium]|nr:hypothetical protein [Aquificota bacterium]